MRAALILTSSLLLAPCFPSSATFAAETTAPGTDSRSVGRELFHHEWSPGDPRSRGGDGLGPVYNAKSCVACHFLGGSGGAGPNQNNVDVVSLGNSNVSCARMTQEIAETRERQVAQPFNPQSLRASQGPNPAALIEIHPGFRNSTSIVLHKYGVDPEFRAWRAGSIGFPLDEIRGRTIESTSRVAGFSLNRGERNTPALFGAGLIDSIPEVEIERLAERQVREHPGISGRVSRVKGGRIGRFGWKGQMASLEDFVMTACAVEVGLEVPGHLQSADPLRPASRPAGVDLSLVDCRALIGFVATLPQPSVHQSFEGMKITRRDIGRKVFDRIGCASCHVPDVGKVDGIFSDLLLHDMGEKAADSGGGYGSFRSFSQPPEIARNSNKVQSEPAAASEWRTPPLWGVSDSAPYLHDGRAATVDQAILLHNGEGLLAAQRYRNLRGSEKGCLLEFLDSLKAPALAFEDGE